MLPQTPYLQLLLPQPTDPVNRGLCGHQRCDQRDLHAGGELADLWGKGVRRTGLDLHGPSNLRVTSATHSE